MAWAAIHNGADAIYLGFPGFNARGRSEDLSIDEIKKIIETCHLYGVKVHIAFNILIFESELTTAAHMLEKIIPLLPDSFIVQDLGLIRLIHEMAPDQIIHASTQMTVTNHEAIHLLEDLNIRRFVLGRENSLDDIQLIRNNTTKELEVFVHGALCVAYSGQCFTSESIGGRSANRGQCAQSCRFAYDLYVDGEKKQLPADKKYLVSPQDLCGIKEIPDLINIGVNSFKIEGRLKTFEYVAITAKEYRKAIDSKIFDEQSIQKMATTYSRGFFSGWLHGVNHQELINGTYSAHRGFYIGKILEVYSDSITINLETHTELHPGDGLVWAYLGSETGGQIYSVEKINSKQLLLRFSNETKLDSKMLNALVYLNHDNQLTKEIKKSITDKSFQKKIPVQIEITLEINKPIKASISDGTYTTEAHSTSPIQEAQKHASTDEFIRNEMTALGGTIFYAQSIHINRKSSHDFFTPHKELKELRRCLTNQLEKLRVSKPLIALHSLQWAETNKIVKEKTQNTPPLLNVLLRNKEQVEDLVEAWERAEIDSKNLHTVILDFEFGRDFSSSVEKLKSKNIRCAIATTRILKPQEYLNLKSIQKINPDAILIRNLGALYYYTQISPFSGELMGDFSLNVTNHLTAEYLLSKGASTLCLSYDLNQQQVQDFLLRANSHQFEITVHQYMPSFHMEHCVFAAFLSSGTSYKNCGKPCEKHSVELKDQFGNHHFIKADQECRNTMFNATPYSAARFIQQWQNLGLGFVRYEALHERQQDLIEKIKGYQDLLSGKKTVQEIVDSLHLLEKYGLSKGSIARSTEYVNKKTRLLAQKTK